MKLRRAMQLCVTLVIVAVSACDRASSTVVKMTPLVVGATAPAYSTRALSGETLSFSGAAAHDVVLLNVWATWCTSCREEFHELEQLRAVYAARGLRVVAVSVDQGGDLKVRQFVAAQKSTFPVAHDRDAKITSLYGVVGLPATYLIGRDGKVTWTLTGSFLVDSAGLKRALEQTLRP